MTKNIISPEYKLFLNNLKKRVMSAQHFNLMVKEANGVQVKLSAEQTTDYKKYCPPITLRDQIPSETYYIKGVDKMLDE